MLAPALKATPKIDVPQVPQFPSMATADLPRKLREAVLQDADLAGVIQLPRIADIARLPDFDALAGAPLRAIAESLLDGRRRAGRGSAAGPPILQAIADTKVEGS